MGKYSIKELEQLSGIKAHTIRIWEKRHRLIEPKRTPTNIRYYTDEDLKKIINVALLNTHGVKISRIVDLSADEINLKVAALREAKNNIEMYIDQLVISMIDMDEEQFEKILSNLILKFGFERTVIEIIFPFLEKTGILWLSDNISPAQEHFISHLIRQKLMVAIDALPLAPKTARKVLLFLPEKELHELGLLFYLYIARNEGFRTYYLGQTVPYQDLISVARHHQPDIIISSFTTAPPISEVVAFLNNMRRDFETTSILIAGSMFKKINVSTLPAITLFNNPHRLKEALISLK